VLGGLLVFLLLLAGLTVLFWAGTLFFQGYIYSEPVEQLSWRAPVAGLAMTLVMVLWCFLDHRSHGHYPAPLEFRASEDEEFKSFWSVKQGKEIPYVGKPNAKGILQYYDQRGDIWKRSDTEGVVEAIVVETQDGQKIRFDADLTKDGKFKTEKGEPVRYLEAGGRRRIMEDSSIGRVTTTRRGLLAGYALLNLLHLVAWFASLWLLLRFQWSHALGFAVVLWLAMSLIILPLILNAIK
jgi:hypothetical protein